MNVYKNRCPQKACGRSSVMCYKLSKEAQPHKAGYEQKVIEEPGKIHWWEIERGRPLAAGKDHMIYHMMSLSKQISGRHLGLTLISHEMYMYFRIIRRFLEHAEFDESNAYVLERFYTSAGNHVKEILLKLNLPDHKSILTDSKATLTKNRRMTKPYSSPRFIANYFNAGYLKMEVKTSATLIPDEVLKLKNFKKDAAIKLFKSTNQERYEHVGPEVTSSQDGKVYKMAKRDYAWLMISRCSRSYFHIQVKIKEQAQA
ncbi:hypothetical protein Tco_0278600 [Tanacetum coccineum]